MGEEGKLHVQDVQKWKDSNVESTGPLFISFFCASLIVPGEGIKRNPDMAGGPATGCMAVSPLSGFLLISPLCTQDLS